MSTTTPELQATIVTPDEATEFAGNVTTLRAEQTGGGYSLVDFTLAADGHGPAPHKHETFDEIYHVIEGTLTVTIESEQRAAPAGSSIFVPRGVVHTFVNNGDVPARFLFVMSPGGFERCFDDLAAVMARDGEITPGAFAEVISGYDVTIAV
jgi:mannose-6-phosphate isomerase-like protein (cupin superfamily)